MDLSMLTKLKKLFGIHEARTVTSFPLPSGDLPTHLHPDDLLEYRLRKSTLDLTQFQFLMVEESYKIWTASLGKKYRMAGKFSVNAETGEITQGVPVSA